MSNTNKDVVSAYIGIHGKDKVLQAFGIRDGIMTVQPNGGLQITTTNRFNIGDNIKKPLEALGVEMSKHSFTIGQSHGRKAGGIRRETVVIGPDESAAALSRLTEQYSSSFRAPNNQEIDQYRNFDHNPNITKYNNQVKTMSPDKAVKFCKFLDTQMGISLPACSGGKDIKDGTTVTPESGGSKPEVERKL